MRGWRPIRWAWQNRGAVAVQNWNGVPIACFEQIEFFHGLKANMLAKCAHLPANKRRVKTIDDMIAHSIIPTTQL